MSLTFGLLSRKTSDVGPTAFVGFRASPDIDPNTTTHPLGGDQYIQEILPSPASMVNPSTIPGSSSTSGTFVRWKESILSERRCTSPVGSTPQDDTEPGTANGYHLTPGSVGPKRISLCTLSSTSGNAGRARHYLSGLGSRDSSNSGGYDTLHSSDIIRGLFPVGRFTSA